MGKTSRKRFTLAGAKSLGDKLFVDWEKFTMKQFHTGLNAESANGVHNPITYFASDDPILIGKIVRSNLRKSPDYYTEWAEMEKAAALADSGDSLGKKEVD